MHYLTLWRDSSTLRRLIVQIVGRQARHLRVLPVAHAADWKSLLLNWGQPARHNNNIIHLESNISRKNATRQPALSRRRAGCIPKQIPYLFRVTNVPVNFLQRLNALSSLSGSSFKNLKTRTQFKISIAPKCRELLFFSNNFLHFWWQKRLHPVLQVGKANL